RDEDLRQRSEIEELGRVERFARREGRNVATEPQGLCRQCEHEQLASKQSSPGLLEDLFRGLDLGGYAQTRELARHAEGSLRDAGEVVAQVVAGRDGHVVQNALDAGVDNVLLDRRDDQVAEEHETRAQLLEVLLCRAWLLLTALVSRVQTIQEERD